MESLDPHAARALLEWQIELGADECIGDAPVNRYDLPDRQARPKAQTQTQKSARGPAAPALVAAADPVAQAREAAAAAGSLEALRTAMAEFEPFELKRGARSMLFADGIAGAPVMIVGEAPNREEDRQGKPFVGAEGRLFDRMFAAIGRARGDADAPIYITNALPWRPPQNRDPKSEELAMMRPFLERHIALAQPRALVLMGNWACQALLEKRGIARLRGVWSKAADIPALPMFHPSYLLRNPPAKKESWGDLLLLKELVDT